MYALAKWQPFPDTCIVPVGNMKAIVITILICSFIFSCAAWYHSFSSRSFLPKVSRSQLPATETGIDLSVDSLASATRKWYFTNKKLRAEEVYISDSKEIDEIFTDLWKGTLISKNIQEKDQFARECTILYAFPSITTSYDVLDPQSEAALASFRAALGQTVKTLVDETPLFPDYKRKYEFFWKPTSKEVDGRDGGMLVLSIYSFRVDVGIVNLENWDKDLQDPRKVDAIVSEKLISNDIPSFPFPTVYEFIAEINRPIDVGAKTTQKFFFRPKDLKYDLKKMAKKR